MSFEPSSCLKQFKLGFTTFLQSSLIQSLLVPAPGPRDLRVFMQSGAPVKRDSVGWSPWVRGSWALMFSFLCALNSLIAITKPLCVSVWHLRALRKILSVHFCGNKLGIYYNWSYAHKLCNHDFSQEVLRALCVWNCIYTSITLLSCFWASLTGYVCTA